jgi:hypothetical protein
MKAIATSIIKHPFTIIFYLLYLLLVLHEIQTVHYYRELQKINPDERLSHLYGSFEVIFAVVFGFFTMCANAISRNKQETPFYLYMIGLIVIPFIIMVKY